MDNPVTDAIRAEAELLTRAARAHRQGLYGNDLGHELSDSQLSDLVAQALTRASAAAEARGAERMREEAAKLCDEAFAEPAWNSFMRSGAEHCAACIRALPLPDEPQP
jgi:hypothetical protein